MRTSKNLFFFSFTFKYSNIQDIYFLSLITTVEDYITAYNKEEKTFIYIVNNNSLLNRKYIIEVS
jgi:hypothetical protein